MGVGVGCGSSLAMSDHGQPWLAMAGHFLCSCFSFVFVLFFVVVCFFVFCFLFFCFLFFCFCLFVFLFFCFFCFLLLFVFLFFCFVLGVAMPRAWRCNGVAAVGCSWTQMIAVEAVERSWGPKTELREAHRPPVATEMEPKASPQNGDRSRVTPETPQRTSKMPNRTSRGPKTEPREAYRPPVATEMELKASP